jgi:integrase
MMNSTRENLLDSVRFELSTENELTINEALTFILKAKKTARLKDLTKIDKDDLYNEFGMEYLVDKSEGTKKDYRSVILKGFLEEVHPDISKENILNYKKSKENIWSNATKCRNYRLLNIFLRFLYENKYTSEDLSQIIEIPKRVEKKQYFPTDDDMAKFFKTLRKIYRNEKDFLRYDTLFRLYAKTAFRKTELTSIDAGDIDFKQEWIHLKKTKNGDEVYFAMDEELKDLIGNYMEKLNIKEGPLLIGKGGRRIQSSVIHKIFTRIKTEAGLPKKFTIHAFRRYFANRARKEGVDLYTLKDLLRHKDVKTTFKYLDITDKEKRQALARIKIDF